jgi:hypothetical protein
MRWIGLFLTAAIAASPVAAQSVLDDIESKITARADELRRAEELLSSPDPNLRVAAMEAIIASGDSALVRKAKEVGLFSDDPQLRAAAIKATLDAGGAFRAEFNIPDDKDVTAIQDWLRLFQGSWSDDGRTGYYAFTIGDYSEEEACWLWHGLTRCAFRMSGDEVATADWSYNAAGSAVMRLDDTGALTGAFVVNGRGRPVTIRIPLIN